MRCPIVYMKTLETGGRLILVTQPWNRITTQCTIQNKVRCFYTSQGE